MKTSALAEKIGASVLSAPGDTDVSGCYIGDLLSRVIGRADAGAVWITIMNNLNVPAVALLAEIPCIILAEGVEPMDGVAEKCLEEGIWLLKSEECAFSLAKQLAELGF